MAAAVLPLPPSPVGSVYSVKVPLPLLRHSTFDASPAFERRAGQKQIQIAIVVVVHKRDARGLIARRNARLRRHIFELPMAQIAKQQHAIVQRDSQIVQIRRRRSRPLRRPRRGRSAFSPAAAASKSSKLPSPRSMQHANRLRARLHQHQVHLPRAGHVHHAGAAGRPCHDAAPLRLGRAPIGLRHQLTGIIARCTVCGSSTGVTVE